MKRTIFEGTVNGEKFDSVAAYNARVQELMDSGEFVEASSNTKIIEVPEFTTTCTCDVKDINKNKEAYNALMQAIENCDEELSFYPYMEEDEPFYLDSLVTTDSELNADNIKEMRRILDKCYGYIAEYLHDEGVCTCEKKDYLAEVKEIIGDLKSDNQYNTDAISSVKYRREELLEELASLDEEETILRGAKPVIDVLLEFYRAVEAETMQSVADQSAKGVCLHNLANHNNCTCDKQPVETAETEVKPQTVFDLSELLDRIFTRGQLN